jgi:diaminopimelate decarboxylase
MKFAKYYRKWEKKMLYSNLEVNDEGHLTIGGADCVSLAKEYGTPLYVMDENMFIDNCRRFKNSIDKYYGGNGLTCYAGKVMLCKEIVRILGNEDIGLDVVSKGELYTAMSVGFPPEKICYHGNNKSADEIKYAIDCGVGHIIADNFEELGTLEKLAGAAGKRLKIMIRVKPGVEAHTHELIKTGHIDSKFGFALQTGEAFDAIKHIGTLKNVELDGLHCHIGSGIFDVVPFVTAAEVMMNFISEIKEKLGLEVKILDLGGGFGIKYTEEDNPVPIENYMEAVSEKINEICAEKGLIRPAIYLEPGRSIAAPAGITLYTVGAVKHIPNIRTYVSVDGGMTDNPRYSLYKARYTIVCANKADKPQDKIISLAGRNCETDLLGENMPLQEVEAGDIIAMMSTGAYNYAMASNYNRLPKAAVVMVKDGTARVIVRRETPEDVSRLDV